MAAPVDSLSYDGSDPECGFSEDLCNGQGDVVIAVMGITGTGKSSFIKLLTDDDSIKVGDSLESETSDVKVIHFLDRPSGRNVTIVDTPGFDDSRAGVTDTDILKKITDYLLQEYDEGRKLNGLIYLQRISDPRFSGQARRNLRMFRELSGVTAFKNIVVLTTFWDQVATNEGVKREGELESKFFKDLVTGGARFMRHDRTIETARQVLRHILPMPPVIAQIQVNIREQGMSLEETPAGSVHNKEVELIIAKHKKEIAHLTAEMEKIKESNRAAREELEAERAELREALARWEDERSELKNGLDEERELRQQLEAEAAKMHAHLQKEIRSCSNPEEMEVLRSHQEALGPAVDATLRTARMLPISRGLMTAVEDIRFLPNFIGKPVFGIVGLPLDIVKLILG